MKGILDLKKKISSKIILHLKLHSPTGQEIFSEIECSYKSSLLIKKA
jgi:hypothetical protein